MLGLTFCVEPSLIGDTTTNRVILSTIQHKTSLQGVHNGFPDRNYLAKTAMNPSMLSVRC
jgi:hypothetical protein